VVQRVNIRQKEVGTELELLEERWASELGIVMKLVNLFRGFYLFCVILVSC
jgi:hypothetical protein